jgi:hypothetical protein
MCRRVCALRTRNIVTSPPVRILQRTATTPSRPSMDKSVAQQEKEIMDVVKRADKNPDKTGAQVKFSLKF